MAVVRPYIARGLRTLRNGSGLLAVLVFLVVGTVLGSHGFDPHSSLDHAGAGIAAHDNPGIDGSSTVTDASDDGGLGGHGGLVGACVALAAAFLLIMLRARTRVIRLRRERRTRTFHVHAPPPYARAPDPPDLIALSIARC
jgi:hypothetical protein